MNRIIVNNFARGMADDRFEASTGEFSIAKQFDVLTNPRRLQPVRGMSTHTANTKIGNLMVASDGVMYGIGEDPAFPGFGNLYAMATGYGGSDNFTLYQTNPQVSGAATVYDLLVDWPDSGANRTIIWAGNNFLLASPKRAVFISAFVTQQSLTFTTIGQGLVHPKDKYLYIPYTTSTGSFIARITPNATDFGGINATAFTLPVQYREYCLSYYGDYLAIPATSTSALSNVDSSIVYLSNRDISLSTFDASIPWGGGSLRVLNNLQGVLIGISEVGDDIIQNETTQDFNSILIKIYDGGSEPTLIKEIKAFHLAAGGRPSVSINPRVNFIYKNRLYFSINVNPNDGIQPFWHGLWSVGRNKLTGEWTVNLERIPVNDNSDTGVIAASIVGDYVEMVHTAVGTLTKTTNGITSNNTYGATSIYESAVNPQMSDGDKLLNKQLYTVSVNYLPLPSGATVTMKYRVDSNGNTSDWLTCFTSTTTGSVYAEAANTTVLDTNGSPIQFTSGRNYEFRVESTGGAVITNFAYKYDTLETLI